MLPDAATCPACLEEVLDPANRRHGYPFTNCTHCGPRYTIVRGLPYDRPSTTMAGFRMCPACRSEYQDPLDRRFHAQPNACPECGPRVELWDRRGRVVMPAGESAAVIRLAAGAVRSGAVLALKGLGGFQLLVDATDSGAVATLRERKRRDAKPFALMVRDLDQARSLCRVSDAEAALLSSVQAPIVLIRRHAYRRSQPPLVAEGVAPGNPWLGLMLPTTPLHHLLLREIGRPVVATSGNLTDEPIATDELDAVERLGALADLFLVHDRPIARHADDSVARVVRGEARVLRRARGYAPMPVLLPIDGNRSDRGGAGDLPTVLAVGAHLKNTVALAIAGRVYVSQHLGDMETPRALDAFERVVADFLDLYDASPVVVAHDLHPDYATTRVALRLAAEIEARTGRPVERVAVQHHHAHLAACLAENGRFGRDCRALGVIWDGTGFGTDRTVWGGELLVGDAASFRRVARLRPFRLPGGDAAVKEPRRSALALLVETLGPAALERDDLAPVAGFSAAERRLLGRMLETGTRAPVTTSAGRLFDGVAALAGLAPTGAGAAGRVSFEGQAAMALELAADRAAAETLSGDGPPADAYPLPVVETGAAEVAWELDWRPLVEAVLADLGSSGRGSRRRGDRRSLPRRPHPGDRRGRPSGRGAGGGALRRVLPEPAAHRVGRRRPGAGRLRGAAPSAGSPQRRRHRVRASGGGVCATHQRTNHRRLGRGGCAMCLGVPGQVVEIEDDTIGMPMGTVSFGGVTKRVCFAYTPEAAVGDYVVVHVGFAISRIDEEEARQAWAYLEEMGELDELEVAQPVAPGRGDGP